MARYCIEDYDIMVDSNVELSDEEIKELNEEVNNYFVELECDFEGEPIGYFDKPLNTYFNRWKREVLSNHVDKDETIDFYINDKTVTINQYKLVKDYVDQVDGWDYWHVIAVYIDKCFKEFVEDGKWYVGLIDSDGKVLKTKEYPTPVVKDGIYAWIKDGVTYYPILWFGFNKKYIDYNWAIVFKEDMSVEEQLSRWEDDTVSVFDDLVKYADDALYAINGDCVFEFPSYSDILEKCEFIYDSSDFEDATELEKNINKELMAKYNSINK